MTRTDAPMRVPSPTLKNETSDRAVYFFGEGDKVSQSNILGTMIQRVGVEKLQEKSPHRLFERVVFNCGNVEADSLESMVKQCVFPVYLLAYGYTDSCKEAFLNMLKGLEVGYKEKIEVVEVKAFREGDREKFILDLPGGVKRALAKIVEKYKPIREALGEMDSLRVFGENVKIKIEEDPMPNALNPLEMMRALDGLNAEEKRVINRLKFNFVRADKTKLKQIKRLVEETDCRDLSIGDLMSELTVPACVRKCKLGNISGVVLFESGSNCRVLKVGEILTTNGGVVLVPSSVTELNIEGIYGQLLFEKDSHCKKLKIGEFGEWPAVELPESLRECEVDKVDGFLRLPKTVEQCRIGELRGTLEIEKGSKCVVTIVNFREGGKIKAPEEVSINISGENKGEREVLYAFDLEARDEDEDGWIVC